MKKLEAEFIFGTYFLLFAFSVYSFSLGYFNKLLIPEYPSYFNALVFFFKNLINTVDFNENIKIVYIIIAVVSITLIYLTIKTIIIKFIYKEIVKNQDADKITMALVFLLNLFILLFFKSIFLFVLVIAAPPSFTILSFLYSKSIFEKFKLGAILSFNVQVLLIGCVMAWTAPYYLSEYLITNNKNLYKKFPAAWSGLENSSSDYIIWIDGESMYFARCSKFERIIYGKTKDGKLFYNRNMSDFLGDHFCPKI